MKSLFGTVSLSIIAMFNMLFGTETEKQVNQEPNQGVILVNKNVEANKPQEVKFEINDQNKKTDDQKELTEEEKAQLALDQARKELITGVKLQDDKKTSYKKEDKVGFVFDYEVKKEMFKDQAPATDTFKYEMKVPDIFDFKDFDAKKAVEVELFEKDSDNEDTKQEEASNEDDEEGSKTKKVIALLSYNETKRILTLEIAADKVDNAELSKGQFALDFAIIEGKVLYGQTYNINFNFNDKIKPISIKIEDEIAEDEKEEEKAPSEPETSQEDNKQEDKNKENNNNNKQDSKGKTNNKKTKIDAKASATPHNNRNLFEWFSGKEFDCSSDTTKKCSFGPFNNDFFGNMSVLFENGTIEGDISEFVNVNVDFKIPAGAQVARWPEDGGYSDRYVFQNMMYIERELSDKFYVDDIVESTNFPLYIQNPDNPNNPDDKTEGGYFNIFLKEVEVTDPTTGATTKEMRNFIRIYFYESTVNLFQRTDPNTGDISENYAQDILGSVEFRIGLNNDKFPHPGGYEFDVPGEPEEEWTNIYIKPTVDSFVTKVAKAYRDDYTNTEKMDDDGVKTYYNANHIDWKIVLNPGMENISYPLTIKDTLSSSYLEYKSHKIYTVDIDVNGNVLEDTRVLIDEKHPIYKVTKTSNTSGGEYKIEFKDGTIGPSRQAFVMDLTTTVKPRTANQSSDTYDFKNTVEFGYKTKDKYDNLVDQTKKASAEVKVRLTRLQHKTFNNTSSSDSINYVDGQRYVDYVARFNHGEQVRESYDMYDKFEILSPEGIDYHIDESSIQMAFKNADQITGNSSTEFNNVNGTIDVAALRNSCGTGNDCITFTKNADGSLTTNIKIPQNKISTIFKNGGSEFFEYDEKTSTYKTNQIIVAKFRVMIDTNTDEEIKLNNVIWENKYEDGHSIRPDTFEDGMIIKQANQATDFQYDNSSVNYKDKTVKWRITANKYSYQYSNSKFDIQDELEQYLTYQEGSGTVYVPLLDKTGSKKNVLICNENLPSANATYQEKVKDCMNNIDYFKNHNFTSTNSYFYFVFANHEFKRTEATATDNEKLQWIFNYDEEKEHTIYSVRIKKGENTIDPTYGNSGVGVNGNNTFNTITGKKLALARHYIAFTTQYDMSKVTELNPPILKNKATLWYEKDGTYGEQHDGSAQVTVNQDERHNGTKSGYYREYSAADLTENGAAGYFTWNVFFDYNKLGINNSKDESKLAHIFDKMEGYHNVNVEKLSLADFEIVRGGSGVNATGTIHNWDENSDGAYVPKYKYTLEQFVKMMNDYEEDNKAEGDRINYTIEDLVKTKYWKIDGLTNNEVEMSANEAKNNPQLVKYTTFDFSIGTIVKSDWYKNTDSVDFTQLHMNFTTEIGDAVYRQENYRNDATLTTYLNGINQDDYEHKKTVGASTSVPYADKTVYKKGREVSNGGFEWDIFVNRAKSIIANVVVTDTLSSNQLFNAGSLQFYEARYGRISRDFEMGNKITDQDFLDNVKVEVTEIGNDDNKQQVITITFPEDYVLNKETIGIRFNTTYLKNDNAELSKDDVVTNHVKIDFMTQSRNDDEWEEKVNVKVFSGKGVIAANKVEYLNFGIFKHDENNTNIPLEGAVFTVQTLHAKPSVYKLTSGPDGFTTIDNKNFKVINGMELKITEIIPPKGYTINSSYIGKIIKVGDTTQGKYDGNLFYVYADDSKHTDIKIDKKLLNTSDVMSDEDKKAYTTGLEFDLEVKKEGDFTCGSDQWEKITTESAPLTVDANGKISIGNLETSPNTKKLYRLKERHNAKTVVDKNPYYIEVSADAIGQITVKYAEVTFTTPSGECKEGLVDQVTTKDTLPAIENYLGEIKIVKAQKDYPDKKLDGATFKLCTVDDDQNEIACENHGPTGKDGVITIKDLKPGKYKIYELEAPDLHVLDQTPRYFTIANETDSKSSTSKNAYVINWNNPEDYFLNERMRGLELEKKIVNISDRADSDKYSTFTAGATFRLSKFENNMCSATYHTFKSDENGIIKLGRWAVGSDCLVEYSSNKGVMNEQIYRFEVRLGQDGHNEIVPNDTDDKIKPFLNFLGNVELTKKDADTEEILTGAKFRLWKSVELSPGSGQFYEVEIKNTASGNDDGKYEVDVNGKIRITNLEPGNYYFEETDVPTGYNPNPAPVRFTIENKVDINDADKVAKVDVYLDALNSKYEPAFMLKIGVNSGKPATSIQTYSYHVYEQNTDGTCNTSAPVKDNENKAKIFTNNYLGRILLPGVKEGKYCLQELYIEGGINYLPTNSTHAINLRPVKFEVIAKESGYEVKRSNEPNMSDFMLNHTGSVELAKKDKDTGNIIKTGIANARFTLYSGEQMVLIH